MDTGSDIQHGTPGGEGAPVHRHRQRLDRQARVGILRNLNRPAVPPPHRPQLMGRWLQMRSSRRPRPQSGAEPDTPAPPTVVRSPLVQAGDNGIAHIDIGQLMASIEGVGQGPRQRARYGADLTGPALGPTGPGTPAPAQPAPRVATDRLGPEPQPGLGTTDAEPGGLRGALLRLMHRLPGLGSERR